MNPVEGYLEQARAIHLSGAGVPRPRTYHPAFGLHGERDLLGRDLKPEEARYFTEVARRIAAILLLSPALDANYLRVKDAAFDWSSIKAAP